MSTLSITPLPGAAASLSGLARPDSPARIHQGARDFEALLLAQMLRSAREASGLGPSGGEEDEANSSLLELGEQQFAQALSGGGGLGIAKMVEAGLKKHAD